MPETRYDPARDVTFRRPSDGTEASTRPPAPGPATLPAERADRGRPFLRLSAVGQARREAARRGRAAVGGAARVTGTPFSPKLLEAQAITPPAMRAVRVGPRVTQHAEVVRMRRTTRGSSIVAMTRIRPEQFGQANASTETTRWGKSAQLNVAPANRRRQRSRVHEHRPRRLGVPPRRRAPLQPTRQARGQRLHRVLQRVVSGRVLERELVRRSR